MARTDELLGSYDDSYQLFPTSHWGLSSGLVSLEELVLRINAQAVARISRILTIFAYHGEDAPDNFDAEARENMLKLFSSAATSCEKLGLLISSKRMRRLAEMVREQPTGVNHGPHRELRDYALDLEQLVREELASRHFLYVPPERVCFLWNRRPMGEAAYKAFPSADFDAYEASNCIALSRPTACVFHCMRVLERILVVVATDIGVPTESLHLDSQQTIIDQVEKRIREMQKAPRSEKTEEKAAELAFYSDIASRLSAAKDAWRNNVSHARSRYSEEEAQSIFEIVRNLAAKAATRIQERARP